MWFIGDEVEQGTSAPPPKKILDPPLFHWFFVIGKSYLNAERRSQRCPFQ